MRRLPVLLVLLFALAARAEQVEEQLEQPVDATRLKAYAPAGGAGKKLYEVNIEGEIDLGLAPYVERVVQQAGKNDVIAVHIKTFGGRIDAAVRIRDALLATRAKTFAFIDQRAISAGALISLAADTIIMTPGASIGAATPVQTGSSGEMKPTSEKVVSYMRAEMRATAEAKGRRADIAEAMVDADVAVPGISPKGKLLTLTAEEALKVGIADAISDSFDDAVKLLNLSEAERVHTETHWGEKVARALTDPVVSSLLMSIGMLGLLAEFYTGGHGIGGAIGLICLALFFFGQYASNLAGWEELLLFAGGAVLLLVEIFFIPGFGVTGILGIAAMAVALVLSLFELHLPFDVSFELGYFQQALESAVVRLAVALVVVIVGAVTMTRYLPSTRWGRHLVLQSSTGAAVGYVSSPKKDFELLGKTGRALSKLRPAGIAELDGRRVDVVSEGEFIDAGSTIQVLLVDGNRVVVKKVQGEGQPV